MFCSKCKHDKDPSNFWKKTKSKTGFNSWCKDCCRESARVSIKTDKQKLKGQIRNCIAIENKILKKENKRICSKCKEVFTQREETNIRCDKCESIKNRSYRERNKEKEIARFKKYREENRELINKKRRENYKRKKNNYGK